MTTSDLALIAVKPHKNPTPSATSRNLPRYRYFENARFFLINGIVRDLLNIAETLGSEFEDRVRAGGYDLRDPCEEVLEGFAVVPVGGCGLGGVKLALDALGRAGYKLVVDAS